MKPVILWLSLVCLLVYIMVLVGGVTRITDSGLSMVEWRPIMGALPPTSDAEWNRVFELYRQSPEYEHFNAGMSLGDFKQIFFWEWFHRLIGRLIGVVYFLPLLFFQVRGYFKEHPGLTKKLWIGFFLGGSQGLLGWFMVKSGLIEHPDVSHYRLAAHLGLALIIFCYLFWILLSLVRRISPSKPIQPSAQYKYALGFTGLLAVQILWGAFTAGLKAGYGHNTFPDMTGRFFPHGGLDLAPLWINFFENNATVQFVHRSLGWGLVALGLIMVMVTFLNNKDRIQRACVSLVFAALILQFLLGVGVIVLKVPMGLAVVHQSGAFVLLMASITFLHLQRFPLKQQSQPV